jgi:hypothetical protein
MVKFDVKMFIFHFTHWFAFHFGSHTQILYIHGVYRVDVLDI